jgi:hypothetical protein
VSACTPCTCCQLARCLPCGNWRRSQCACGQPRTPGPEQPSSAHRTKILTVGSEEDPAAATDSTARASPPRRWSAALICAPPSLTAAPLLRARAELPSVRGKKGCCVTQTTIRVKPHRMRRCMCSCAPEARRQARPAPPWCPPEAAASAMLAAHSTSALRCPPRPS